jgi:hypothetical protein
MRRRAGRMMARTGTMFLRAESTGYVIRLVYFENHHFSEQDLAPAASPAANRPAGSWFMVTPASKTGSPPRVFLTILIDPIGFLRHYLSMRCANYMGGLAGRETRFLPRSAKEVLGGRIVFLARGGYPKIENRV